MLNGKTHELSMASFNSYQRVPPKILTHKDRLAPFFRLIYPLVNQQLAIENASNLRVDKNIINIIWLVVSTPLKNMSHLG